MFKLNEELIAGGCYRPESFHRGLAYYNRGAVTSLRYMSESDTFFGMVQGSSDYLVKADFTTYGRLQEVYCSCPDFEKFPGFFCKHIVAVLIAILKNGTNLHPGIHHGSTITEDIFQYFNELVSPETSSKKKELTLGICYNFHSHSGRYYEPSFLELKIGLDRLYVVRKIKDFLEAFDRGQEIFFGKNFTLDPREHTFSTQDSALINLIRDIYKVDKYKYPYDNGDTFFVGKGVRLPEPFLEKFFNLLKERTFDAYIEGRFYRNISILKENLPLTFLLNKEGENLIINNALRENPLPLTESGSYFFYQGHIYEPSKTQSKNYLPFANAWQKIQGKPLVIHSQQKEKFVSEVLPKLAKTGQVEIDEILAQEIDKIPLRATIYLDLEDGVFWAELKFIYGERIINPFSRENPSENGRILLRDIEKERAIMHTLEKAEFKVNNAKIYLDDEEKIFDFSYFYLSKLQDEVEIYYSERLKNFQFIHAPSFRGRISLDSNENMLDFSFNMEGISQEELYNCFMAYREKKKYFRLRSGAFLPLDNQEFLEMESLVSALSLKKTDFQKEVLQIPKYRALYFDQLFQEKQLKFVQKNKAFRKLTQDIRDPEELEFPIPEGLDKVLRHYQKTGFFWMKTLAHYGFGGILADDMGLGKTLQAITFILSEKEKNEKPALVIAPTSLIYNWQEEVEHFAPSLKTKVITGTKKEREELLRNLEEVDLVITSYPLVRRDIENYLSYNFSSCILDEAQNIKNSLSQTAKACKMIKADNYFALTGTPMENSLIELWSIFDFLMPGFLPPHHTFMKKYLTPIEKEQDQKATQELARLVRPFILRRIKKDVLKELPPKIENKMVSELSIEQKKVYLSYRERIFRELASEIKEKGFEKSRIKVLAGLTRLRQICCHPGLFLENYQGESGKLEQLKEVLKEIIASGHRVLIFSQFTQMLSIIKDMLEREKYQYFYLDGSVKPKERLKRVANFNKGQGEIFLISLKAGGTGLNLTGADVVIHFDPWWNPAVEDQASDRAHRMGQKRIVQVMKFIARGTIEEKIYDLQEKKKELIDKVIQPGEEILKALGEEDFYQLLDIS